MKYVSPQHNLFIGAEDVEVFLTKENCIFDTRKTTSIGTESLISHILEKVKLKYGNLEKKVKDLPVIVSIYH